jgi:imidazolonepropionase-like amidohydrolase
MKAIVGWLLAAAVVHAQTSIVLKPARVFDGEKVHENWVVVVKGDRIEAAGPAGSADSGGAKTIELSGLTVTPGLVEGHSHMLLHPYNETPWNDQVAHEGLAL